MDEQFAVTYFESKLCRVDIANQHMPRTLN